MVGVQKRKIRWAISLFLVMLYFSGLTAQAQYGGGSGAAHDPYLIYTAEQMNTIGANPNDWDKHFKLMADIDLSAYSGTQFNIIGIGYGDDAFRGVFDGNGHTISNFSYISTDRNYVGLFGYVRGVIKDLGLIEPNVDAGTGRWVGSLVGQLGNGTITGCYAEGGSVSGKYYVGGLTGYNGGTITNCYATGSVSGGERVGGLAGESWGYVTACSFTGIAVGNMYVGGLLGYKHSAVSECCAKASVSGTKDVGGLIGYGCCGTTSNCYATGSVAGTDCVGGLAGSLTNLVLIMDPQSTISKCYATSLVRGNYYVGGFVGLKGVDARVDTSFWDIEISGQINMCGAEGTWGSGCDNANGKTTAEMQMASTFTNAGWDFVGESVNGTEDIWSICEGTNYPRLAWQIPASDFVCPDGITIEDFVFFIEHWRDDNCDLSNDYCDGTDLDFSGTVDEADLEILVENWLAGSN